MKKHLHYYSDCSFFAGCENMLVNFFDDESLQQNFDLSFSYRYTPEYKKGLMARARPPQNCDGLLLLDYAYLAQKLKTLPRPISLVTLLFCQFIFLKYVFILINTFKIKKHLKKMKIDLLHINNGGYPGSYSCYAAIIAAKMCKIPRIVYVVNNMAIGYQSPSRWPDFILDHFIVKKVDRFITGSIYAGRKLKHILNISDNQHLAIHNGIKPRQVTQEKKDYLSSKNIPTSDRIIIGVVALFEYRKGHQVLLEALNLFKNQHPQLTAPLLLFEGNGPLEDQLKKFVQEHQLQDDVIFIKNEKEIFNFMNALDILALPSIEREDFPNVISEAMSLAKPILATLIAGIPEQVESGVNGLLVPPNDSQSLADALVIITSDSKKMAIMGTKSKEKFEQNFLATKSVARYISLYKELLNQEV